MIRNWELYLFIAPAFLYFLIFHYGPMYGIQIAFKNFIPTLGVTGSPGSDSIISSASSILIISGICYGIPLASACMSWPSVFLCQSFWR